MDWTETEGKTYEEAVKILLNSLGAHESEVEIINLGKSRKLLGFGTPVIKVRGKLKKEAFIDELETEGENRAEPEKADLEDTANVIGKSKKLLQDIIKNMGIDGISISVVETEKSVTLDINSDVGGLLIGKRGGTLEALQTIIGIYASRLQGERSKIIVDTENYRTRRKDILLGLAKKSAKQSEKTGRKVPLGPMTAYERKIIHSFLQDNPTVTTKSEGRGENRQVVVFPVK